MTTELKLPELGENIDSGNVVKILVSEGDHIAEDQPVMELETDKATIEVPSSISGIVEKIHVKEGSKAKVGEVVLTVRSDGQEAAPAQESKKEAAAEPAVEEHPQEAKATEQKVEKQAKAGEDKKQPAEEASKSAVEEKRSSAEEETAPSEAEEEKREAPTEDEQQAAPAKAVPASPSIRKMAREIGVDISHVSGSGPGGRISAEDVKRYARQLNAGGTRPSGVRLPDFAKWGTVERKAMSSIRLKTAEHLSTAWSNIPQVTQFDKADTTELEEHRKRFAEKVDAAGGKLTVTAILLKVISSALRVFPQFNASLDMGKNEIIFKKYYHIGVAVDTDRGLLVPVIRDVDKKNILQLSVELTQVSQKARNKKITLEEMQGGTFTITNLGGIGGTYFSPIVNFPEVAILGISRAAIEPAYLDGNLAPRMMLPLSLSYDHRIIDGADAARFLHWVVDALKDPFLMALEG